MPLRSIVLNSPETLSDVLLAADDRYAEAEELLVEQRFDGAVYLLGYAAEMWLKAACVRLRQPGPASMVKPALAPRKHGWLAQGPPATPFGGYHDLAFLADCVIRLRLSQQRPLSATLHGELQGRVINGLYAEWIVDM